MMKKEYDFSKGARGKFFRPGAVSRLPVYLDSEVQNFVQKVAENKQSDIATVVNDLLRSDMRLGEILK
jgi:hypothetical protein